MAPAYPSSHKIYAYLNDVRTDLSADIIGNIVGNDWGISGNGSLDRIGTTGQLKFSLNNKTGKYTPGSLTALAGWDEGIAVELSLGFEGNLYLYRFYVESIKPPVKFQDIQTKVTAVTWMKYATEHPIENPGALANKRGNDVLNETLALMPIQPQNINFDEGINIFPVAFDVITSQTKAYDEFVKVALSEIGYVYEIHDRQYGETLRFENARSRTGLRELSSLPVSQANSGFLLKPDGFYIRTPANDRIILNQVSDAVIDNAIMEIVSEYGNDVINHFTATATPRRVDTSFVVLFNLDEPIALGSGPEIEIKGTYADPAGGAQISAQDVIDPVITTDYLVFSAEDGSGSNLSGYLTFTFKQFGTEGFTVKVKNTYPSANGWLTKFNVRGHGVYNYNPISVLAKNQTSIDRRGTKTATLTQKYKNNLYEARVFVEAEVNRNKDPRIVLNAIGMCANTSAALMTAFLNLHPGDLANIIIDKLNVDGYYYIQGVDNVSISTGGIINFDWMLREALSLQSGLSPVAVEFDNGNYVNYGFLPQLSNIIQKTISVRIYYTEVNFTQILVSQYSTATGDQLWFSESVAGKPVYSRQFTGDNGQWRTTNDVLTALVNSWVMVTITFDGSNASNDPIIYINGSSVAVTEFETPTGTVSDDTGNPFIVANRIYPEIEYQYAFQGKIKDVRIYDRVLTATEVTTLYNSGTVDNALVTDGLVFQGLNVRTSEYADYVDDVLTIDQKIIDNIYGAVGTPNYDSIAGTAAPIGRAP